MRHGHHRRIAKRPHLLPLHQKSRIRTCSQKQFIREEELERQLSTLLAPFSLPADWADEMLETAEKERENADQSSAALVHEAQLEMADVKTSLNRLVSIYVSQRH